MVEVKLRAMVVFPSLFTVEKKKFLGILTNVQDFYAKNQKMLAKEIRPGSK